MFKLTKLITIREITDCARLERALKIASNGPDVHRFILQPTLPGSVNGGDYIWHLQFSDRTNYEAWKETAEVKSAERLLSDKSSAHHVDAVTYTGGRWGSKRPLDRGVYRTMLVSLKAEPDKEALVQYEAETYEMGLYIGGIVNWQISRVEESLGSGTWSHIWEQEYASLEGLTRSYMRHPHHWGWINRWYDPECPEHIFGSQLCHSFCDFTEASLIAPNEIR